MNVDWQEFIRGKEHADIKYIVKLSDWVMRQQNKILGHIIRAPASDLMAYAAIDGDLKHREQFYKKTGKPRMKWVGENCKYVYNSFYNEEFYHIDPTHIENIRNMVKNYEI